MQRICSKLIMRSDQKEKIFTQCLCDALCEDDIFFRRFIRKIFESQPDLAEKIESDIDAEIQTQVYFDDTCVAMVIKSRDISIGIENQLWSPDERGLLSKYIKIPQLNWVVFITGNYTNVPVNILENPYYLKPLNGRDHFIWHDFYDAIRESLENKATPSMTVSLLQLFEHLGFESPHPRIGDLLHFDKVMARKNRQNFAGFWEYTRQGLKERGWQKIASGLIAGLYVQKGTSKYLEGAWLDPIHYLGSLRVRLNFRKGVEFKDIKKRLEVKRKKASLNIDIVFQADKRKKETGEVLEIVVPLKKLFEGVSDEESMSRKLAQYTLAIFDIF